MLELIQVSTKNISSDISYTKYSSDLKLGEGLCIGTSFHFPDSGLDLFWITWHWKPAINTSKCALVIGGEVCVAWKLKMLHDVIGGYQAYIQRKKDWFMKPRISQRAETTRALRARRDYKVAMTSLLLQNTIIELWASFRILTNTIEVKFFSPHIHFRETNGEIWEETNNLTMGRHNDITLR